MHTLKQIAKVSTSKKELSRAEICQIFSLVKNFILKLSDLYLFCFVYAEKATDGALTSVLFGFSNLAFNDVCSTYIVYVSYVRLQKVTNLICEELTFEKYPTHF